MNRKKGRAHNELRPVNLTYNFIEHAAGSVLFQIGKTKVVCTVTLQNGVPSFLKGQKTGWLNAEYSMLPASTHVRKEREVVGCKRNGRSMEISRLIGRSLRAVIDLAPLGERTIVVDCDVLQADGGTRTAAITGSYAALVVAVNKWIGQGIIQSSIIREQIAAVSLGVTADGILLDLDFSEDSAVQGDFNFVLTASGKVIEVQGSAEQDPIAWSQMGTMYEMAFAGVKTLVALLHESQGYPSIEFDQKNQVDSSFRRKPFNPIVVKNSAFLR